MSLDAYPDLPPPQEDDVLFGPSKNDILANACLHFSECPEVLYSAGYLNAARMLRDHVLRHRIDLDTFIFPIIYLYRHHVELVMKGLVVKGVEIVGRTVSAREKKHLGNHNLNNLWEDLQPVMNDVIQQVGWDKLKPEHIRGVDSYIRQLTDHPPDAFRFPTSKEGEKYLTKLTHINVCTFSYCMEKLLKFFDGLDAGFDHLVELKNERLANAHDETG